MERRLVGRWISRGGKYWMELHHNANNTFAIEHETGGAYLGFVTLERAMTRINEELASYEFDGHKMKRAR